MEKRKQSKAMISLLCLWSFLIAGTDAFKPTLGQGDDPSTFTHESITAKGVDKAAVDFLTSSGQLNTSMTNLGASDIVKDLFFGSDTHGYQIYLDRRQKFADAVVKVYRLYRNNPDYTVNSERIREADSLVKTTRLEIASILSNGTLANGSIDLLIDKVGKCLMIIQSFYSNTNWIEMMVNGGESFLKFGTLAPLTMNVAASGTVTCQNCDYSVPNACKNNLLVHDRLTSGYLSGQLYYPKPNADPRATEGKCSHGGVNDFGRDTAAIGGINKETPDWNWSPHAHLHNISGETAIEATEAFFMDATTGLLRGIENQTIEYIFQLKKAKQNVSMGFVVDVTGSMSDDISSVKKSLIKTVSAVIGTENEPQNYVLATFNDPANLTTVNTTTDGNEMIQWIDALRVYGGGDCPEYAMSGIQAAIAACIPHSTIYVATDADAKDEYLFDTVQHAANAKHIKITFILTSSCGRRRRDTHSWQKRYNSAFEALVASTGGNVYHVDHSEVTSVLDHALEKDFPSSEAIIDYFVQKSSENDTMDITVDCAAAVLVIAISGPNSLTEAFLSDPNGTAQRFPSKGATQYYSSHKITMSVQRPSAGIWKLTRFGDSAWNVNVTASTYFDIDSQLKETDRSGISYVLDSNPVMGKSYILEVLAYNMNLKSTSFTLHIIDEQGDLILSRVMRFIFSSSKATGYTTVVIPSKNFYVQLSGVDQNGFAFKRMSRKLFTPVSVELFVQPILGNLEVGTPQNITYKVSNFGGSTQTYTVSITDDKGRVLHPTYRQHNLRPGKSATGHFQIMGRVKLELITYTVSVKISGTTAVLQSSTTTSMFAGSVCSSFISKKCISMDTGSDCSLYKWSATVVFSFDVSTYANSSGISFSFDSTDKKRIHASGTCCQETLNVNASSSTGSWCQTSKRLIESDKDTVDLHSDGGPTETQDNESEPEQNPVSKGSDTGLIVGIVIGTGAVVGIAASVAVYKVSKDTAKKRKTANSVEKNGYRPNPNSGIETEAKQKI
ncbi:von Willebrand factor A domain-containing protein 7-like [Ylistrum balloti]|uniref:von Willebrand factor A domain-containing protein 7-like n=1 Tax=Ylistrum balloti TaxID=509963 RepID=UPI002905D970|nr:von Willebrand factor A domain-containing protein 7-like [Ylistrum balloti]